MNDFNREPCRIDIIPIDLVLARENAEARRQWEAARANRELRERQDEALRYLALKQWQRDNRWWRKALRTMGVRL